MLNKLKAELYSRQHPVYWTMRNGKRINIREMSNKHLKNTIAMLERAKAIEEIELEEARQEQIANMIEEIGVEDMIRFYI